MSKKTEEVKYNYRPKPDGQKEQVGKRGKMAIALTEQVAKKKQLDLFSSLDEVQREQLLNSDNNNCLIRDGKEIVLNASQYKLLYGLADYLSLYCGADTDVKNYIETLDRGEVPTQPITKLISLNKLAKMLSKEGKARSREMDAQYKELEGMSKIENVLTFETGGGDTGKEETIVGKDGKKTKAKKRYQIQRYTLVAPLIRLGERGKVEEVTLEVGEDGVQREVRVETKEIGLNITFSSLFFAKIKNRYAITSQKIYKYWINNELFPILLSDLLSKYSGYRIRAQKALGKIVRKNYSSDADYFKARKKVEKAALTYTELAETIKDRVLVKYDSNRNGSRFLKDLYRCLDAIKEIGLITEYYTNTKEDCKLRINFVFNMDYTKEESKALPLPAETVEEAE